MSKLIIYPKIGIGEVKLLMDREEVHTTMGNDYKSYRNHGALLDCYDSGMFRIYYDKDDKVEFIELNRYISNLYEVLFEGIDVFNTKAEDLVSYIDNISKYDRENPESAIGFGYIFKDIGLSLWRSNVFSEEILQKSWFQELTQENIEEEMKFMYFEAVSLAVQGYWDK